MKTLFVLLNASKFGPALWSSLSIVASIWAYALLYGWRFAAGFVGLIFVHEMGHYLAAMRRGLPVSLPMFIPFMGAFIALKDQPKDAETEAYVAYAGPLVGSFAHDGTRPHFRSARPRRTPSGFSPTAAS